jgi:FKBP-type peptidyl-prolyl cis-trans isomerase SlyD
MRINQWALILSLATVELFSPSAPIAAQSTSDDRVVKNVVVVSLQYTLSGEDGKTIESNKGKEALKYTQGQSQIIPGLEKGIAGMKVGAVLVARGPEGQSVPVRVHQIKEKTVVVDMNHPMAGKTLVFDVKILDIQAAAAPQPPKPAQPAAPPQPAKPNPSK